MRTLKVYLAITSALCLAAFSTTPLADVYVCNDKLVKDCNIKSAVLISPEQYNLESQNSHKVTVRQALEHSSQDSVRNGYSNTANTDIYLKKDFWHEGGTTAFPHDLHITTYVYKGNNKQKTCHTFSNMSPKSTTKYFATCD